MPTFDRRHRRGIDVPRIVSAHPEAVAAGSELGDPLEPGMIDPWREPRVGQQPFLSDDTARETHLCPNGDAILPGDPHDRPAGSDGFEQSVEDPPYRAVLSVRVMAQRAVRTGAPHVPGHYAVSALRTGPQADAHCIPAYETQFPFKAERPFYSSHAVS